MKHFAVMEVREAIAHAAAGGQSLHTHRIIVDRLRAPACFVHEVDAGRDIAHLFDRDEARLRDTVKRLGVRVVVVERRGTDSQHVDLCAGPLRKALAMCETEASA
jgi:hypothetical protein